GFSTIISTSRPPTSCVTRRRRRSSTRIESPMHNMSPRAASFRAHSAGGSRSPVQAAQDFHLMQEMTAGLMQSEMRQRIERFQNYGFSSALLPSDQGSGEGPEAIMNFLSGQRTHSAASVVDDRRHRPHGFQPGENAQYDDIGQMTLLRRNFVR